MTATKFFRIPVFHRSTHHLPRRSNNVKSGDVKSALWAKVDAPSIDPSAYDVRQVWYSSKDGTKIPMFVVGKKGIEKNGKTPHY